MAIGSRYSGGIPDYIGMGNDATQSGINEAKSLSGMLDQGYQLGTKMADRTRRDQARTTFGNAWASGDPKAIERAMQLFPEYAEQAQKFIGIRDDQHRKDVGSLMGELSALAQAGDYKGAVDLVNRSGGTLDSGAQGELKSLLADAMSGDEKTSSAAKQRFSNLVDSLSLTALTPQERAQWQNEQARLAQQLQLGEDRIGLQRELGQQRNQLGYANLSERQRYHNQILNLRSQMTDKQQEIAERMNWNAWGANNKPTIKQLGATLQAEGRLQSALSTGTPIGDVSAMLQFLVQEAPNLSPRISQAMGVSSEAAAGVLQHAQQAIGDLQNGRKLQPQQIKDLKIVSAAMKQSVQNNYYGLVSPALVGVDLTNPKQAQTAMKRTNLPLPALTYIQQHADEYDQFGFGSGVPEAKSEDGDAGTVDFGDLKK